MIEDGVSHVAYFRLDGGSSKLYTQEYVDKKDKEIERLNNIITEYGKWLLETAKKQEFWEQREIYKSCFNKLDKLQELKESENNES